MQDQITHQPHHDQCQFSYHRSAYRQGKDLKAVKVYTILDESCHLLIQNVPAIKIGDELKRLCYRFGRLTAFEILPNYPPKEEYTETFYIKYKTQHIAKTAKKRLDNREFFGSKLHVFYAPELETVEELESKLKYRHNYVAKYNEKIRK